MMTFPLKSNQHPKKPLVSGRRKMRLFLLISKAVSLFQLVLLKLQHTSRQETAAN